MAPPRLATCGVWALLPLAAGTGSGASQAGETATPTPTPAVALNGQGLSGASIAAGSPGLSLWDTLVGGLGPEARVVPSAVIADGPEVIRVIGGPTPVELGSDWSDSPDEEDVVALPDVSLNAEDVFNGLLAGLLGDDPLAPLRVGGAPRWSAAQRSRRPQPGVMVLPEIPQDIMTQVPGNCEADLSAHCRGADFPLRCLAHRVDAISDSCKIDLFLAPCKRYAERHCDLLQQGILPCLQERLQDLDPRCRKAMDVAQQVLGRSSKSAASERTSSSSEAPSLQSSTSAAMSAGQQVDAPTQANSVAHTSVSATTTGAPATSTSLVEAPPTPLQFTWGWQLNISAREASAVALICGALVVARVYTSRAGAAAPGKAKGHGARGWGRAAELMPP